MSALGEALAALNDALTEPLLIDGVEVPVAHPIVEPFRALVQER